jgi:hypothetical protein
MRMPTYEKEGLLLDDFGRPSPQRQAIFLKAVRQFVADLKAKQPFRASLRVKGVQGHSRIFEMTWQMPDGRATFRDGAEKQPGEPHIIWRRIGGHEIFSRP